MFEKPVISRRISRHGMLAAMAAVAVTPAAAVKVAGKPEELIEVPDYAHLEMAESLGNRYGPNGRAALALMRLGMG
jgi:hypothetical protein